VSELAIALELVDRKIDNYAALVASSDVTPPDHRPAPRTVRPRAAG
jgi:hypothetical protein